MKKVYLLVAGLLCYCGLYAQQGQDDGKVDVIYPVEFKITKPLRELVSEEKAFRDIPIEERQEARDKEARRPYIPFVGPEAKETSDNLPVVQKTMGTKSLPLPLVSWDGLNDGYFPPDPTGAAGSGNYYVQGVNTSYKVYSKTGSSLTSAFGLSSLWSGTTDDGDPIILYHCCPVKIQNSLLQIATH